MAYVASKTPRELKNAKRIKVDFCQRKSATKFLCAKTFSGNVVSCKAFTSLSNSAQMVDGRLPYSP